MADKVKTDAEIILEKQFEKISRKLDFLIELINTHNEKLDQEHLEWEKKHLIRTAEISALEQRVGRLGSRP